MFRRNMKATNVIITVEGGFVRSVYSTDAALNITVLDYDAKEPFTKEEETMEAIIAFVDTQNRRGNETEYVRVY